MGNACARRGRRALVVSVAAVLAGSGAGADTDLGGWQLSGAAELGGRVVHGDFDSSKYEEYREYRPGVFGSGSFLLEPDSGRHYLRGFLRDVGERDEAYELEFGRWGHYRLGFDYSELPHVFGKNALSFYDTGTGAAMPFIGLHEEPLRFRLRTGGTDLLYRPSAEDWSDFEFSADYHIQDRQGSMPFSISFGNPGDNFINVARPVDERIHEVNAAARWAHEGFSFEAGYTGSFFQNDLNRLQIPNFPGGGGAPASSTFGAAPEGQISLAPDNSAHVFRLAGAAALPVAFPARLAASFAYGERYQDEDFLCHTINTALDPRGGLTGRSCPYVGGANPLDLPEDSLEGEVNTLLANLVLTARPTRRLNVTARYRMYQYDNDTPSLLLPEQVESDFAVVDEPRLTVANEYRRQNASLDTSYRLTDRLTVRTGYAFEQWHRSDDRSVRRLDEHGGKLALDYRASGWLQLRSDYEYAVRRGNDYDPFAYLDESHLPGALDDAQNSAAVFSRMKKFDQADRVSNRIDLLALVAPRENLSLSFTGSYGEADYDHTTYGLQTDERYSLGGEARYQPISWLSLSAWYTYEGIEYKQRSRWRPRDFAPSPNIADDPVNDWKSRSEDQVHNIGARAMLTLIPDRLDATFGYGWQHARGRTRSTPLPGCLTIGFAGPPPTACVDGSAADQAAAVDFPELRDTLQSIDAVLSFHVREDLTLQAGYRFEKFTVENYKIDGLGVFGPPRAGETDIFLGEQIDDYRAHILALSMIYKF